MTDEPLDLAPIEARHSKLGHGPIESFDWPIRDRHALLAEVKRLRAQLAAVDALTDTSYTRILTEKLRIALGKPTPFSRPTQPEETP